MIRSVALLGAGLTHYFPLEFDTECRHRRQPATTEKSLLKAVKSFEQLIFRTVRLIEETFKNSPPLLWPPFKTYGEKFTFPEHNYAIFDDDTKICYVKMFNS